MTAAVPECTGTGSSDTPVCSSGRNSRNAPRSVARRVEHLGVKLGFDLTEPRRLVRDGMALTMLRLLDDRAHGDPAAHHAGMTRIMLQCPCRN
jgi:hypothetical protein